MIDKENLNISSKVITCRLVFNIQELNTHFNKVYNIAASKTDHFNKVYNKAASKTNHFNKVYNIAAKLN